jgi:hypothetical protein
MKTGQLISLAVIMILGLGCAGEKKIYVDTYSMQITGGIISAYELVSPEESKLLDTAEITSGEVSLKTGKATNPVMIQITNAKYKDPLSDNYISFGEIDSWSAIANPNEVDDTKNNPLQVNPLTTLTATHSHYKLRYSNDPKGTVENSKSLLKEHFRVDLEKTAMLPNPEEGDAKSVSGLDGYKYFLIISGLSVFARDINNACTELNKPQPFNLNDLTRLLVEDVSYDGIANGISGRGQISICGYMLSNETLKSDFAEKIRIFMKEKGIEETPEIFDLIQNIINDSSELFAAMEGPDFTGPMITVSAPELFSYISGNANLEMKAEDPNGVVSLEAFLGSEGHYEIIDKNLAADYLSGIIYTKDLLVEGTLNILAIAKDTLGNESKVFFTFYIDNTSPIINSSLEVRKIFRGNNLIRIEVTDPGSGAGLKSFRVEIDPIGPAQLIYEPPVVSGLNVLEIPFDASLYNDGPTPITIKAVDRAGNITQINYAAVVNNLIMTGSKIFNAGDYYSCMIPLFNFSLLFTDDLNLDGYPDIVSNIGCITENLAILLVQDGLNIESHIDLDDSSAPINLTKSCDINKDGKKDLVVGDPYNALTFISPAEANIYFGPISSTSNNVGISLSAPDDCSAEHNFADNVGCEDMNGDGFDDVIVTNSDCNKAYIYFGPDLDDSKIKSITIANSRWGIKIIGDINNDGLKDVVVGDYIVYGSTNGSFLARNELGHFHSISSLADINNDGYFDFVIGDPDFLPGGNRMGIVKIIYGGPAYSSKSSVTLDTPTGSSSFGQSVSTGDVDGDGYNDIVIGSPDSTVGGVLNAGEIYVFLGPDFELSQQYRLPGPISGDHFGTNVQSGYDANKDGRQDIVTEIPGRTGARNFAIVYDSY